MYMEVNNEMERYFSTKEFANLVGRSVATVYDWVYQGKLTPIKDNFSNRNLFTKEHYKEVTGRELEDDYPSLINKETSVGDTT